LFADISQIASAPAPRVKRIACAKTARNKTGVERGAALGVGQRQLHVVIIRL